MFLSVSAALVACADLAPLATGICGNAVVDADEDCDGHAASSTNSCAAPGTPHACRYVCGAGVTLPNGSSAVCPLDQRCGVDGVCREASGAFGSVIAPAAVSSMLLLAADFDGDQQPLLFAMGDDLGDGRRLGRLIDPVGTALGVGTPINQPMASPTVLDLDGDGHQDIAFVDYSGIGVLRGDPIQNTAAFLVLPFAPPADAAIHLRAIALEVARGPEGQDPGDQILTLEDDGQTMGFHRSDAHDPALVDLTFTGKQIADLAGDVVKAKLDTQSTSPCDQVLVALKGLDRVPYFSPCGASGWADPGVVPSEITLAPANGNTAVVSGPAYTADLNADGNLDVVVGTTLGPYVAYGRGDGTFASASDLSGESGTAAPLALQWLPGQTQSPDMPLAILDLNGDGASDFVFPSGIALTDAAQGGALYWAYPSAGWAEAVSGSGDHGPFVVAASNSAGVEILQYAADTGQLVDREVPTATLADHLVLGDFDGDLVTDVAFAQESDALGAAWSVIYDLTTAPTEAITMGTFDALLQLSAAHLAEPSLGSDGISDLVISAEISSLGVQTVVTSQGAPTRQMIAPFELRDPAGAQALPLAVAAGQFLGAPSLAALGAVDPTNAAILRFWMFPPISSAASELVVSDPLPSLFHPDDFDGNSAVNLRYGAHLASGDLDSDGADEVVMIAPYGSPDSQSALVVAEVENGRLTVSAPVVFSEESTRYSLMQVVDLDGDHADDVLFKGLDDDTPQDVLVFWNDGEGNFSASEIGRIHVDGEINAFACVEDRGRCNLFVTGPSNTFAVTVGRDRAITTEVVAGLPGGLSLAAGDFNGDGLDDLAVGNIGELRVFQSVPRLP